MKKKILEKNLKIKFNTPYVHLVGQCREGIYFAVKYSIETSRKKEVIISSYTLYHVVNMIIHAGGIPIFLDLEKNKFQNNFKKIKDKINNNTACIILTHLFDIHDQIEQIQMFLIKKKVFFY